MKTKKATEVAKRLLHKYINKYRKPKVLKDILIKNGYFHADGSFNKDGFLNLKGR